MTAAIDWAGKTIDGRYTLVRLIGRGGMGVVYEADHAALDRRVAVKLIARETASEEYLERFRREAKLASRITHEHLVHVYDVGTDAATGAAYLVMELVEGKDVAKVLDAEGRMEVARAVGIAVQMLEGLAAVHAGGIVHRDIKPHNVLLAEDDFVKLMDFGVARAVGDASLTMTGHVMGTPQYMSPEQVRGHAVDHRTDLYAVGVTLFTMLAGRLPFDGANTAQVAGQHVFAAPPSLTSLRPEVPAHVAAAVAKALAKKPEERFANAEEMAAALGETARAEPVGAAPPPSRRGPGLVVAAFAIAALAAAAVIVWMKAGTATPEAPAAPRADVTPEPKAVAAETPVATPSPADDPAQNDPAQNDPAQNDPGQNDPPRNDPPPPSARKPIAQGGSSAPTAKAPPGPARSCQCIPTSAPDVIGLCKEKGPSVCRCDLASGQTLCPTPLAEDGNCDDHPDDCNTFGYSCADRAYAQYHLPGRADEACAGYLLERFKAPTNERLAGHFECDVCAGAKLDAWRGQPGDACEGFYWRTGDKKVGTLAHCE